MPVKGIKQSPEHIAKRMASWKQSTAYIKAKERFIALNKSRIGIPLKKETKEKQSVSMQGKQNSLGTKRSVEYKMRLSEYWKDNPNHNHYVDGKCHERSSARVKDMGRLEYRLWRQGVFERDNYTCQHCGKVGYKLAADHIKPYSTHPELRYDIDNGRTLCMSCHTKTDTYGGKALLYKESSKNELHC